MNRRGYGGGQRPPPPIIDTDPPLWAVGFSLADRARLLLLDLRLVIMIPVTIVKGILSGLLFILSLYRTLIYLALIWLLWYLLVLYWPYFMLVIIHVLIPIVNVLILLFNLAFNVFLIILRLLIMCWNIFVPFVGIIVMVVFNIVFAIIGDIFDAIGNDSFEPIIAAIMQILSVLVDIFMKIVGVLLKVGMPILIQASKVVGTVLEVIMMAVKIILPIVMWIVGTLFKLLEPILEVVSWYFGGIASIFGMSASMATGRSLLSLKLSPDIFDMPEQAESSAGSKYPQSTWAQKPIDDYYYDIYQKHFALVEEEIPPSNSFETFASSHTGRNLLQSWAADNPKKLKFKDENAGTKPKGAPAPAGAPTPTGVGAADKPDDETLSAYANNIAYQLYKGAKNFDSEEITMANGLLKYVLKENKSKENVRLRSLIREFNKEHMHLEVPFENTLSAIKFRGSFEHPDDMRRRFSSERKPIHTVIGRKLLDTTDWEKNRDAHLSQRRIEEARAISAQEAAYREHEFTRMKFVTVAYNSASTALKTNLEAIVTPGDLIAHWDDTLRYFGYKSLAEVRQQYIDTYGDSVGFLESFSWIGDHPIFKHFQKEESPLPDNLRFLDWEAEQKALKEARQFALNGTKATGRSLLEVVQQNQDVNVAGNKESKESFGAFPMISTRNCFSNPKNKMCIPQIPASFHPTFNTIKLTDDQKRALTTYVIFCEPWHTTFALIDFHRLYNVLQQFRFFVSAIPFFNRNIATLTKLAPWTSPLLNQIFLVPKYQNASLFQWVCFANHLYDVFVWGVAYWALVQLYRLVAPVVITLYTNVMATRITTSSSDWIMQRRLRGMDKILSKMQARGQLDAQIGQDIDPSRHHTISNTSTSIGSQLNVDSATVHNHHYYAPTSSLYLNDPVARAQAHEHEIVGNYDEMHHDLESKKEYRARMRHFLRHYSANHVRLDPRDIDPFSAEQGHEHLRTHPNMMIVTQRRRVGPSSAATAASSSSNRN